jgi:hypothetical protein
MFKFTIEVCGKDVAVIAAVDRCMLDATINADFECGYALQAELKRIELWDGESEITYRLATWEETMEFECEFDLAMKQGRMRPVDEEWFIHWLVSLPARPKVTELFPIPA